ncbi:hypothetical protein D6745_02800 [Candidatus Woesearchaeota archaeon]|nr:MAG: hypothetical protein D6745_02800 [Candidatus Woesearchaeota archaeon]
MLFTKRGPTKYDILREGEETILRINYEDYPWYPSIEEDPFCMSDTCNKLAEVGNVTKIVFSQKRDFEYDYNQTQILMEIAKLYNYLIKQKDMFSWQNMGTPTNTKFNDARYNEIKNIISNLLRSDPVGAYVTLKRIMRREKITFEKTLDTNDAQSISKYMKLVDYLIKSLEKTKLITIAKPYISGYKLGDRSVYKQIFSPLIKPDFMYTKLMASYPKDAEELDSYSVGDTEIIIFEIPGSVQLLYHMMPPEFKLSEEKYEILDLARNIMAEHKPKRSEFVDPERMRQVFYNVGHDLLEELAQHKGVRITQKDLDELTKILIRYTVGFGLIEVLLEDEKIQDISINSPMGQIPIFVVHQDFGDCNTNIIPIHREAESWASKLRLISGRPLDEANPILDTELELPSASARVSVITEPLNPTGLAFSYRRHRNKPWTFPLFIHNKMMNPLAAGILSFCVDGTRTMLIAGTRSSGKTSLLSSIMVEIMRKYRIITIEDTLELPTNSLRKLGFNIQPMKVASALAQGSSEMSASDGIRATLRLGDSSLIVGEVRSTEAKALYEAMRVGAAANVVAGTIHGDSPYGVFDRVVNDIGVPKTSFKATDLIIVANPIKSADGLHRFRRITQITEVRKLWEDDPMLEKAFVDLMKYNPKTDTLDISKDLINGDSEILKSIAGNIKEFAGDWDAVWDNIQLRAKTKEAITRMAEKANRLDLLEADFVIEANDRFHQTCDKVKNEVGSLDSKRIFLEWESWLKREFKKR